MEKWVCFNCGATFNDSDSRIKNETCLYCGHHLLQSQFTSLVGVKYSMILIFILLYVYYLFMAFFIEINLFTIFISAFSGFLAGLMILKYRKAIIEYLNQIAMILTIIFFFSITTLYGLGWGSSIFFKIMLMFIFFMIISNIILFLGVRKSKAELAEEKIKKNIKKLNINHKDLDEFISQVDGLKHSMSYRGLFKYDFKKLAINDSEMELGKNNLFNLMEKNLPILTPFTNQFIDKMNIDAMYFFLENIYKVKKIIPLERADYYNLYHNHLDEAIIFALDKFMEIDEVPLLKDETLKKIYNVKWDRSNKKFFKALIDIKSNMLNFENQNITPFKIFEKKFILFLAACAAVNNRRGYLENTDFIKAYKTYFKLLVVDITAIKPYKIIDDETVHQYTIDDWNKYNNDRYNARFTLGGLFAVLVFTKYLLFYFDSMILRFLIPFAIILIVSYNLKDEYVPGIIKGELIAFFGSIPVFFTEKLVYTDVLIIYLIAGFIASYLGIVVRKIKEGTFRSTPKEIELKNRIGRGYLICEKCGWQYKIKPWQSPDDFDKCDCGGKLDYYEELP